MKTLLKFANIFLIFLSSSVYALNISISEKESISYNELIDKDGISFLYSKNQNVAYQNSLDGKTLYTGFANQFFSNGKISRTFVYIHGIVYGLKEFNSEGAIVKRSFIESDIVRSALESGVIQLISDINNKSHDQVLSYFEKSILTGNHIFRIEGYKDGKIVSEYSVQKGNKLDVLLESLNQKLNAFSIKNTENRENSFTTLSNLNIMNFSKTSVSLNYLVRKLVKEQKLTSYSVIISEENGKYIPYLLDESNFSLEKVNIDIIKQKFLVHQIKSKKIVLFSNNEKLKFLENLTGLTKDYFMIKSKIANINQFLTQNTSDVFINTKEYFSSGSIKEISNFSMSGSREGNYILFFENNRKHLEGNYKNNLRNGEWTLYDSEGRKKAVLTYEMGNLITVLGINDFPTNIPFTNFSDIFNSLSFSTKNNEFECLKFGSVNTILKSDKTDFNKIVSFSPIIKAIDLDEVTNELIEEEEYDFPDVEAEFPGGEIELQKFLKNNVKFPELCMDMDASGRIFMKFTVEKDGTISNIQVEKNTTGCDDFVKEATRVLNLMPKWSAGEVGGDPKRSTCRLPFNFKIG
jgi:antitoxin component YwqK of YwqJK toxin-antitoxin module